MMSLAQIDFSPLQTAKWLYIEGYLSTSPTARAAVREARRIARTHGVKIALTLSDPAMVQYAREGLDEMIDDGVDLLFCNEHEAMMYTGASTAEQALEKLKFKSRYVVITRSAQGAILATAEQHLQVPGSSVIAVDANGAGDAFAGALLYAMNAGMDIKTAAELAILISSEVVANFGPRLTLEQYRQLLQKFKQETP